MLISLHVRNFALIDHLDLAFGPGLNILTGETGAGKSIVIDALGIALGERSSAEMIRSGTDRLSVEAVFSLSDAPQSTRDLLRESSLGNDDDSDILIMAREVNKNGKSQSRVNGRLIPTSILRSIGQDLVDVHGQHEHQSLLSSDTHVDLLDNWLGSDVLRLRQGVSEHYRELLTVRREIDVLRSESRERARNLDLYRFQQEEISNAGLKPGEQEQLVTERSRLANVEKLTTASEESYDQLASIAGDAIGTALVSLQKAVDLDATLQPIVDQLIESSAYLEEAVSLLRHYRDTLDTEPGQLDSINERLDVIHSLERKYGDTIAEVLAYASALEDKLGSLEESEEAEAGLLRRQAELENETTALAAELTRMRKAGGTLFSEAIVTELVDLGMAQSKFETSIDPQPLSSRGQDKVEFLISTNPGEPLRPLAKVASGGETSRLMLAIKSILARSSYVPTMIFDEIDTGIGGRTGKVLADKLSSLSEFSQILCITHLPQIASRPSSVHFSIEKSVAQGRTKISVMPLNPPARELEIARMLGGENSDTVLQHAREMLSTR